jgi:ATP-dependent Lon protease
VTTQPAAKPLPHYDLRTTDLPAEVPVLYLVSQVIFPYGASQVRLRMASNLQLLDELPGPDAVFVVAFAPGEDPEKVKAEDIGHIGVAARVIARLKLPDGSEQVTIQGLRRVHLAEILATAPYFRARVACVVERQADPKLADEEIAAILAKVEDISKLDASVQTEHVAVLRANVSDPGHFADLVPSVLGFDVEEQRKVLEIAEVLPRLKYVSDRVQDKFDFARVVQDTDLKVRADIDRSQREFYLRRQMKVLRDELGEVTREEQAARDAEEKLAKLTLPPAVATAVRREIDRLRNSNAASAEYSVIENYLDWMLSMPWNVVEPEVIDLDRVRRVLDHDHYGLEQPKQRILEYLAVRKLAPDAHGPVLCFVGPPGTGKTSLAQSIARAMKRKLGRISVGGVRDESEIRGHRRTYVGAMPGRIVEALRHTECSNPVLVIDEIDKMGEGNQGDPAAALLEVLDPEQNAGFVDHYLDVAIDLSKVFFIATANDLFEIPGPLRDRMEVIELSSYVEQEKLEIAKRHLVPKTIERTGLAGRVKFSSDALSALIDGYTAEAGVRDLGRQIESVCRKLALRVARGEAVPPVVKTQLVTELLGPAVAPPERRRKDEVGVVNGLAWTGIGGDVLLIEGLRVPGDGEIQVTGSLGDVMRESCIAAWTFVKSRAGWLGIDVDDFKKWNVHLHFPEGATPKDGPSAGIAITTALASLFTNLPVRADLAMTGEVTLRGQVLPIGGLREKLAAAARLGIKNVIIPKANIGDLYWVRDSVKKKLNICALEHVDEVLEIAIVPRKTHKPRMHKPAKRPRRAVTRRAAAPRSRRAK